ncbi:MAG: NAD(P)-dependent oxidoreductase [Alphaproteobacteria bacterium]|nr:NAD(P)-dependent oxidoreductase [Alphaproteobacteria bacterium]
MAGQARGNLALSGYVDREAFMAKLAFLGLGVMGYPMAGHLKAAGHDVTVYNRSTAKAEAWVAEHGGAMAPSPKAAAEGAEFVFACVGADDDLRQVTIGDDGAFQAMAEGAIFIDNTTASADVARELYATAKAQGLGFIDAPADATRGDAWIAFAYRVTVVSNT